MKKFEIIQVRSDKYKKDIIHLWADTLAHTPEARFEWMKDNPAGKAIWYLAVHVKTGRIVGSISILPKNLHFNGKNILAGIVGDFMIEKSFRAFGPALQLLKAVIESFSELRLQLLYTIPNKASEKIMQRVGFQKGPDLINFTKIIKPKIILEKKVSYMWSRLLAPVIEFGLRIVSKETYTRIKGSIQEISEFDNSHTVFFNNMNKRYTVIGERNGKDLNWRFFRNPENRYRVLCFYKRLHGFMTGYVAYSVKDNRVHVYDIIPIEGEYFSIIMGQFLKLMKKSGYDSISIGILSTNPFLLHMKYFGFMKRNDNPLYFLGDSELILEKWLFFDGDRNL